jgi:5-hydroxyisourate hydrolase
MGQLTTHILNTSTGRPAKGVNVKLEFLKNNIWEVVTENITNEDGRITDFTSESIDHGTYRINFETEKYFSENNTKCFYPYVSIVFVIDSTEHYHVPLLLNPYGYSTYRGS